MQIMSEKSERTGDAAIGGDKVEEGQNGRSDNRTTKMEIEPLKIKTLADFIGVCREKGYQVYNDKPNIPEADRIRAEELGRQSIYTSKKHHRDDRKPNLLVKSGSLRPGENSSKAGVDWKSEMTDVSSNKVASRTSAWSSYYSRSQATTLPSKQTECDDLADAEEILQQRMRRQSKRRREKRPGALVDLMLQMTLPKENEIATEPNTETIIVPPATTDNNTVPINVTNKPNKVTANGDKTKPNKTKGSNPISGTPTAISNRGKAQDNNKSEKEPLRNPKASAAKNKKGNSIPKLVGKDKETKKMPQTAPKEKEQTSGRQNHAPDNQIQANQNTKVVQSTTNIKTGDKKKTVQDHSSSEKENPNDTVETKTQIIISSSKNKETDNKESPQRESGIRTSNDSEKEIKVDKKRKSIDVALNSKNDTGEATAAVSGQPAKNSVREDNLSEMVEEPEKTTTNASYENENPKQTGSPLTNENDDEKHVDNFHSDSSVQQPIENNDEKVLDEVRIKDGNSTLVLYKVKEQSLLNLGKGSKDVTWNQEEDSQITAQTVNSLDSAKAKTDDTSESKEKSETKTKSDETKSTKCSPSKENKMKSKVNKISETLSKKAQLILIIEKVKQTNEECSDLHMETINLLEEARKSFRNQDTFDEPETDTKEEINDKVEPEDTVHETEPEEETISEDGDPEPDEVEFPPNKKKETNVGQCFIYRDPTLDTTHLPVDNVYIVEAKRIFPHEYTNLIENKSASRKRTGKYSVKHVNSRYADFFSSKNEKKIAVSDPEKKKPVKRIFKRVGSVPPNFAGGLNEKYNKKQEVTEFEDERKNGHRSPMKQVTFPSIKKEPVTASSNKIGKEVKHKSVSQSEKNNKVLKQANGFSQEIDSVLSNENKTSKNNTSKQNILRYRNYISKTNSYPKFEFKTNKCRSASFTNRVKHNNEDANPNKKEGISIHQSASDRTSPEKLPTFVPNGEESRATLKSGKSDTSISAAVEIVHSRTSFYKGMLSNGELMENSSDSLSSLRSVHIKDKRTERTQSSQII